MTLRKNYLKDEKSKSTLIEEFSRKEYDLAFYYSETPSERQRMHLQIQEIMPVHVKEYPGKWFGKQKILQPGIFILSPPYSYEMLERWLYIGNWQALYPPKQLSEGLNSFREKDEKIEKYMIQNGLEIFIDSFHDNTEWNVFTLQRNG